MYLIYTEHKYRLQLQLLQHHTTLHNMRISLSLSLHVT